MVVLSDHHKGRRDQADDFVASEPAYCAALGHYLEQGFHLHVLGDAEELWENDPGPVLAAKTGYAEVLALEAEFHAAGRYDRYFGNHDDLWSHPDAVRRFLHPIFPGLRVREGLKLRLTRPGKPDGLLFLVHGHQGSPDSDRRRWLARLFVRHVWRPIQRKSGYTGVTPSRDYALRARLSRAMSDWALRHPRKPVLIAGHTHKPVFWDTLPKPPDPPAGDGRAQREYAAALKRNPRRTYTLKTPCYFNAGCCCFADGDVTGLEIADGEIRLVRWSAERKVIAARALDDVLDAVD
jgi:hypothetical protein